MVETSSVQLPPNKTYACRSAIFNRVTRDGFKCCGVIEVSESAKPTTKKLVRRYAIQELDQLLQTERRFQVSKPIKRGEPERYYVSLKRRPQADQCTCDGYSGHGHCVHIQSLRALLDAGHLPTVTPRHSPPPKEWADA